METRPIAARPGGTAPFPGAQPIHRERLPSLDARDLGGQVQITVGVVVEPVGHRNCRVPGTRRPPRMTSLVTRIVGHLRGRGSALWPLVPSLALPGREGTGLFGGPFIVPAAARLLLVTLAPLRDLAHSRWAPTSGPRATSDRGAVSIPTSSCAIAPARCDHTRRRWATMGHDACNIK